MNKILSGVLGIVMVASITGGTAYALFTSQATVNGISLSTGSASLLVEGESTLDAGINLTNLFPGFTDSATFTLTNASTANIALAVKAQLTAAGGDWADLSNVIEVAVKDDAVPPEESDFYTLAEWNAAPIDFGGDAISQGADKDYEVTVRVPESAGDEIAGKSLTNITFVLTGTQVTP